MRTRLLAALIALGLTAGLNVALAAPAEAEATAPPNAFTGLTATAEPEIPWWIRLDWVDNSPSSIGGFPNDNADTFVEVERCQGVGCTDWANIFTGYTPGWDMTWFRDSDSTKTDATTYSYRVRGRNAFGTSEWSAVASATTGWRAPSAPSNLVATYVGANAQGFGGNTHLTWTDNATTEVGYRLSRCEPINCAATRTSVALATNTASYLDTTVVDGQEYSYAVDAVGAGAFDGFGQRITHVAGTGYAAPRALTASLTRGGVKLTWRNAVSRPIRIWRCDTNICIDGASGAVNPNAPWTVKTTLRAGTSRWTDFFSRQAGTRYFYRLQVATAQAVSPPVYVDLTAP